MSPLLQSVLTSTGGVIAGLAAAGGLLWRQHRALRVARYQAGHDDTTGLPNRRTFLRHLAAAIRAGGPVGVVLLDLDAFKTVNDTYGHETGNDLLTAVGDRLARLPVTVAARLSGDEFALLVHGWHEDTAAAAYAAWRAVTEQPIPVAGHTLRIHASVGFATAPVGVDPRQVLHHADLAMYEAKISGRRVHGSHAVEGQRPPEHGRRTRDRHRNHRQPPTRT